MKDNQVDDLALLLKSISHPIRLKILCLLQDKELTVSEIREEVETSGANISQHLNIMRNQGIVGSRKEANYIYNKIADQRVIELMKSMQHIFCSIS